MEGLRLDCILLLQDQRVRAMSTARAPWACHANLQGNNQEQQPFTHQLCKVDFSLSNGLHLCKQGSPCVCDSPSALPQQETAVTLTSGTELRSSSAAFLLAATTPPSLEATGPMSAPPIQETGWWPGCRVRFCTVLASACVLSGRTIKPCCASLSCTTPSTCRQSKV